MIWVLEVYLPSTKTWKEITRSTDFSRLYNRSSKLIELGNKIRLRKQVV